MPNLLDRYLSEKEAKKNKATGASRVTKQDILLESLVKNGNPTVARRCPQVASGGPSASDPLPTACPLVSRRLSADVMAYCRFGAPLLGQLIEEEVMPIDGGCPFLNLCGLLSLLPDHPHRHKVAQAKKRLSSGGGSE